MGRVLREGLERQAQDTLRQEMENWLQGITEKEKKKRKTFERSKNMSVRVLYSRQFTPRGL
jgi:uncharacterized membrane protein